MKTHFPRAAVLLILLLILVSCSKGGLSGTYAPEDGSPGTLRFSGDTFHISVPYSAIQIDKTGDFSFGGTFTVLEDTVVLSVDMAALAEVMGEQVRDMYREQGLDELLDDETYAGIVDEWMAAQDQEMILTYEDGFKRLYSDGQVYIKK